MPPKAAVAQTSAVDAKFKADQERVMERFGEFVAGERPPLSVAEYSALIPQYVVGPHWSAQEDAELQAEGRYACILDQGQDIWEKNRGVRFLWRLFPMVYRCLPTDLFSWAYQIDVDTSKNFDVETPGHDKRRNVVWSQGFCNALANFTMHGFWEFNREWDFPVMAQLMQLAVICRTNDCRPWRPVNPTEDTFFTELAAELQNQTAGVRTIKDVVGAVEARMKARNLRPSPFRLLCQDIVRDFFKPNAGPLLAGTPGPYKVTVEDLTALVGIMNHFGPSTGIPIGWSAETWKTIMEKSWAHDNRQEPQPNRANGMLLARAIMYGLMARERDEKIAERAAQAGAAAAAQPHGQHAAQALAVAAAQAQIQAQAQPASSSSSDPFDEDDEGEDTEMADQPPANEGAHGRDRPDDDDEMGGFPAGDEEHADELELSERARADKEAADKWIAETLLLKAFAENRSPSPTRGRISRGPLFRAPKEYIGAWEEEDEDVM